MHVCSENNVIKLGDQVLAPYTYFRLSRVPDPYTHRPQFSLFTWLSMRRLATPTLLTLSAVQNLFLRGRICDDGCIGVL